MSTEEYKKKQLKVIGEKMAKCKTDRELQNLQDELDKVLELNTQEPDPELEAVWEQFRQ